MKKEINSFQNPPVKLMNISVTDNVYHNRGCRWTASTLIKYCEEQNYPVFTIPVAGISLDNIPWDNTKIFLHFCDHMKRAMDANLDYPIILDEYGYICDGWHRLAKAIVTGKTEIKAIRIEKMPKPDGEYREEE